MDIISANNSRVIDVGSAEDWLALKMLVERLLAIDLAQLNLAVRFLETGCCKAADAEDTAMQFNLIRDKLSSYSPDEAVAAISESGIHPSWMNGLSPVVTSCGNMLLTADGEDLLFQIVSILVYGSVCGVDIATSD